ncbi:unnamed protein product, partial [marine sediment metagenome]
YRHVMADSLTPVVAFRKLAEDSSHAFLFESVTGGEKLARYSFMGCDPFSMLKARGSSISVLDDAGKERQETGDPFEAVREMVGRYRSAETSLPRLAAGGAVGYIGYDAVRHVENLPSPPPDVLGLPDVYLCFYDTMLVIDHINNAAKIVCGVRIGSGGLEQAYKDACSKVDQVASKLVSPSPVSAPDIVIEGDPNVPFSSNFEAGRFQEAVTASKEYISAGDIIQVVLSQRLTMESPPDPFSVYRSLRMINPSPYMFHLRMDDAHLVG